MKPSVSYGWQKETLEAKARWFQSLTMEERIEVLCGMTDLILALNPRIADSRNAEQIKRGARILSAQ